MKGDIGKILKTLRNDRGLNQADLGKILNVANNTISSWERGNSLPDLYELIQLAQFFDVSTDYLLGLVD